MDHVEHHSNDSRIYRCCYNEQQLYRHSNCHLYSGCRLCSYGGSYSITWETHSPAATVSFLQKGKVVATAEGKVVDRGTKYPSNEVVFAATADGGRQVQEIRFRGSSEVIVFVE